MYDIAIIGAGPAGTTLARLLGGRYRVLLAERKQPSDRPKCCGGLLAPDAQKALAGMGLSLPEAVLAGPQIFAVRAVDLQSGQVRHYQRHYLNLERGKFEAWLASLVPPAVDCRYGWRLLGCRRGAGGFELEFAAGSERHSAQARLLVGADGARSLVRRLFMPEKRPQYFLAIQETLAPAGEEQPYFTAAFDKRHTDGYGWVIPKGGALLCGALMLPGGDAPAHFSAIKAELAAAGLRFGGVLHREGAYVVRPRFWERQVSLPPDVALVGEAAGFISPSSSEGISYALASALFLAGSLTLGGLDGFQPFYRLYTSGLRRGIREKCLKAGALYTPWLRRAAMSSGVGSFAPLLPLPECTSEGFKHVRVG